MGISLQRNRHTRARARRARPLLERIEPRLLLSAVAVGSEFRANTTTVGAQVEQRVAADSDGNYVLTWASGPINGTGFTSAEIIAQRYSAAGAKIGGEITVNTSTAGVQDFPWIAMDADGDFVIAWNSDGQDGSGRGVFAQRFNAAGTKVGTEFQVNTTTSNDQENPAVSMDADGDFVIAWESYGQDAPNGFGVYAQRYAANGTPDVAGEVAVNTHTDGDQYAPTVALDPAGDFVITWSSGNVGVSGQDGSGFGIYARRYDATGAPKDLIEQRVNTFVVGDQLYPYVAIDPDGDYIIAWHSNLQDGDSYGVYAQRFSAAGVAQGLEFRVNTFTAAQQQFPVVAMDADGDFTIAWESNTEDGFAYGVYARSYSAAGASLTGEFRVNTTTANQQYAAAIASDPDGDLVIAWQSFRADTASYDVMAQRYGNAPTIKSAAFNFQTSHSITIAFSENVAASLVSGDVAISNLTTGAVIVGQLAYNTATNVATITFSGNGGILAEGNYHLSIDGADVTDAGANALDGDGNGLAGGVFNFDFFFLMADANRDKHVDTTDFNILAGSFGQSGKTFSQGNFSYDAAGLVNTTDFNLLASKFAAALPAIARPVAAPLPTNNSLLDELT